jgi:glycosyltransferase involved in cell wall biosynthesis
MAYGLVPFVVANGGPATVVRDGVTGYHYRSIDELEARAVHALGAPAQLENLRPAAAAAADEFAEHVFIEAWRRLAATHAIAT